MVKELVNSKFMFKYNKQDFEEDNLIEISKIKLNYRILEAKLVDKFYSIDESFSELAVYTFIYFSNNFINLFLGYSSLVRKYSPMSKRSTLSFAWNGYLRRCFTQSE